MRRILFATLLVSAVAFNASAGTGKIIIINNDAPGIGLNDPTPAQPVGGNPGTTVGQQRMNVFLAAAARWSSLLDTNVDIQVQSSFAPLECSEDSAVLGSAGPRTIHADFTNAPKSGVLYPAALANKFAGFDLSSTLPDIVMQFNGDLDKPTCLGTQSWYYGLDGNEPGSDSDLLVVVLHELGHGLGMTGGARAPNFNSSGFPSVFDTHTLDLATGLRWDQMSQQQRNASLTNTGKVVWDGPNVRAFANRFLQPVTVLSITEPALATGNYDIGNANFGPLATSTALTGRVVRAIDVANSDGPTTFDGCTAFTNADAIRGNVAMIDRGGPPMPAPPCTFVKKARNAQAAGAIGVIIVDNSRETCTPPALGGDAADITIPVFSIGPTDGDVLKAQLTAGATMSGSLRNDPSQLAGTSKEGYVRLYAPCTDNPGSSIHHWDVVASPSLLMEPFVNGDLRHGVDLTQYMLLDIGWSLPAKSGRRALRR
jgi:hypothetical protein